MGRHVTSRASGFTSRMRSVRSLFRIAQPERPPQVVQAQLLLAPVRKVRTSSG